MAKASVIIEPQFLQLATDERTGTVSIVSKSQWPVVVPGCRSPVDLSNQLAQLRWDMQLIGKEANAFFMKHLHKGHKERSDYP